ncbi:MAG: substrate-binding domain-containing protein, partial [Paracoccaceae bacterium]
MYIRLLTSVAAIALTALPAIARDQINIVGSSTVFPFSTTVAERFGKSTAFKTPVVESTGSGGGMKLFCAGVGESTPDITNASRRIKSSEAEKCAANGITPIEAKIGFDGIVLANSRKSGRMEVTRQQIFLALAKDVPNSAGELIPNPYAMWSEIDSSLPAVKIEVL